MRNWAGGRRGDSVRCLFVAHRPGGNLCPCIAGPANIGARMPFGDVRVPRAPGYVPLTFIWRAAPTSNSLGAPCTSCRLRRLPRPARTCDRPPSRLRTYTHTVWTKGRHRQRCGSGARSWRARPCGDAAPCRRRLCPAILPTCTMHYAPVPSVQSAPAEPSVPYCLWRSTRPMASIISLFALAMPPPCPAQSSSPRRSGTHRLPSAYVSRPWPVRWCLAKSPSYTSPLAQVYTPTPAHAISIT